MVYNSESLHSPKIPSVPHPTLLPPTILTIASNSLLNNDPKLRYPPLLHRSNMRPKNNPPLTIRPRPEAPPHHAAIERSLDDAVGGEGPVRGEAGLQVGDMCVEGFTAMES